MAPAPAGLSCAGLVPPVDAWGVGLLAPHANLESGASSGHIGGSVGGGADGSVEEAEASEGLEAARLRGELLQMQQALHHT